MIKVKATEPGFIHERRYEAGDEFMIHSENEFSSTWMVKAADPVVAAPQPPVPPVPPVADPQESPVPLEVLP